MDEDIKDYLKECTKSIELLGEAYNLLAKKYNKMQEQIDQLERIVGSAMVK